MTQNKTLKGGFTTGACAAAATRAALHCLVFDEYIDVVNIPSLTHESIRIPVHLLNRLSKNRVECVVIKDAGDDPDVTHKAEIGARVEWCISGSVKNIDIAWKDIEIEICGGQGVGTVTKPGLEVMPGNPAINSGPVKMIRQAVHHVLEEFMEVCSSRKNTMKKASMLGKDICVREVPEKIIVEIFVPEGEALAQKTLNARLGILGGISILGTTGIVKPMSHDAYIATIKSGISVAQAMGDDTLVFTTGRRSERFAMSLFPHFREEAFIQTGDFFMASLEAAAASTTKRVIITVFFGKAVKMAMGFPHTHAAKSELTLQRLAMWATDITGDRGLSRNIESSNTARHAFSYIHPDFPDLISHVGHMIIKSAEKFSHGKIKIDAVIFDFEGKRVFDSMVGCRSPEFSGGTI
ncbi:cobalt-precorrin-5B (C(1))-methyltransferase CbiD [Desulfocicer niacini]